MTLSVPPSSDTLDHVAQRPSCGFLRGLNDACIVDTSERAPVYLVTTAEGAYLRLSASAYQLLSLVENGVSLQAIAVRARTDNYSLVTPEDLRSAYERLVSRIQTLSPRRTSTALLALRFGRRLVSGATVRRASSVLKYAYRGPVASCLVVLVIAGVSQSLTYIMKPAVVVSAFWPATSLLILSLIAHEFGHAAACAAFGGQPNEIGVGLYLIYPAFYSDVTDAWRLSRYQRVIVDLGGVYFQIVVGAIYALLFMVTGWASLRAAVVLVAASCAFSLNPLLKFDGYWMISDGLGLTNLRSQPRALMRQIWSRLRKRSTRPMQWSPLVATGMILSGAATAVLSVLFVVRVIPVLWAQASAAPEIAVLVYRDVAGGPVHNSGREVSSILSSVYVTVLCGMMFWQLLPPVRNAMRAANRQFVAAYRLWRDRAREVSKNVGL